MTIKGLEAGTKYQFYVSRTTSLGESAKTAKTAGFLETEADAKPTVASVVANDINASVGSTKEVLVTFSEPVKVDVAKGITFTTADGFTVVGVSAKADNEAGDRWVVTIDRTLNDAPKIDDVTYYGSIAAKTVTDSLGTQNEAATGAGTSGDTKLNFTY